MISEFSSACCLQSLMLVEDSYEIKIKVTVLLLDGYTKYTSSKVVHAYINSDTLAGLSDYILVLNTYFLLAIVGAFLVKGFLLVNGFPIKTFYCFLMFGFHFYFWVTLVLRYFSFITLVLWWSCLFKLEHGWCCFFGGVTCV